MSAAGAEGQVGFWRRQRETHKGWNCLGKEATKAEHYGEKTGLRTRPAAELRGVIIESRDFRRAELTCTALAGIERQWKVERISKGCLGGI